MLHKMVLRMKRVGIITIHFGVNYGSALQSYALSNFMVDKGYEVELINYIPERYSTSSRNRKIIDKYGALKGLVRVLLNYPSRIIYDGIFNNFLKMYTPLSKKYRSLEELQDLSNKYDAVIAGSDQIWNSDYNGGFNPAYFLAFVDDNVMKVAYAASSGKMSFSDTEKAQMASHLRKFNAISVRESQMISLMEELHVSDARLVLDPVLLADEKIWNKISTVTDSTDKYLFIYLLDGDVQETVDIAVEIAKLRSLRTVMISFGHVWSHDKRVDEYLIRKSPIEFLNLIRNADFVVTNSFHGMAFSLEFNRQFIAFKRKAYNSRLDSLSRLVGVEDRLVTVAEMDTNRIKSLGSIDYSIVNAKIRDFRKNSESFLEEI